MSSPNVDGGAAGFRGPRKRSKAQQARDLRRAAERSTRQMQEAVKDRRAVWAEGGDGFAVERREEATRSAFDARRGLRRDVYVERPELEAGAGRRS